MVIHKGEGQGAEAILIAGIMFLHVSCYQYYVFLNNYIYYYNNVIAHTLFIKTNLKFIKYLFIFMPPPPR